MKRVFRLAFITAGLFVIVVLATAATRKTLKVAPNAIGELPATEPPERYSEDFIKYIPIFVPLSAIMLVFMVYIIGVAVL